MSRYDRQISVRGVGEAGQSAISAADVLVVGVGGLGSPVLQYLVGAGIGRITLVDADRVSTSNLHRQTLFRESDIGEFKAQVAATTLSQLNSDIQIRAITESLTPTNAMQLVTASTLVLDCADSFATTYILSDICRLTGVPLISASVLGFSGYVGGFCGTAPSIRAVFPDLPDRAMTCATAGVLGPVVGLIGAAQAQMALGYIIGQSPSPLGQLISIDMKTFRTGGFRFDGTPEPADDLRFISQSEILASDFVVELRDLIEAPSSVTQTAMRLTVEAFKQSNALPSQSQRAVFACQSGLRAWQAATHLRSYWKGEISLVAMGNITEIERTN